MAAIAGLRAVHISLIKRFSFPEPVFFPKRLLKTSWLEVLGLVVVRRGGASGLASAREIAKLLNRHRCLSLGKGMTLKPVRNPNTRQEFFWAPFRPQVTNRSLGIPGPLPMFPFQVLFAYPKLAISKDDVERQIGASLKDLKVSFDARLFPAGLGTLHLSIYVELSEGQIDLLKMVDLAKALSTIPVRAYYAPRWEQPLTFGGVFAFLEHARDRLLGQLVSRAVPGGREIGGCYMVYNLQGQAPDWRNHIDELAALLAGHRELKSTELRRLAAKVDRGIGAGRSQDDLIVIDRRASIVFVDSGIWKKYENVARPGVLEGRRCFRHHFVSSLELAYVSHSLVAEYTRMFRDILGQLDAVPLGTSARSIAKRALTFGPFKPTPYVTVRDSVLRVSERLAMSRGDGFWRDVYRQAADAMGLRRQVQELKKATDALFERSTQYTDRRFGVLKSASKEVRNTAVELLKAISPGIKIG